MRRLTPRRRVLERGIEAGRLAVAANASAPEGHFWMAANMGALAEAHGLRQGIKYRGQIETALETALRLNAAYLDGSPDRALGRWYYKVPRLFGGDMGKSEQHLRKALGYKADSIISLLFLAETLIELDRNDEARRTLEAALAATPPSGLGPGGHALPGAGTHAAEVARPLTRGSGARAARRCMVSRI